ncbi:MAG: thioesterase family protein [bacterium]
MSKTFRINRRVTFGDANPQGTMYWAKYCEVVGLVREEFLFSILTKRDEFPQMVATGIVIETCDFSAKYHKSAFLCDSLVVALNVTNLNQCSVELLIDFFKLNEAGTEELLTTTRTKLAFFDTNKGKPTRMPDFVRSRAAEYEVPDPNHKS